MSALKIILTLAGLGVIAGIIFVQAPAIGGVSGGDQSSQILKAAGSSGSALISSLETGKYNAV